MFLSPLPCNSESVTPGLSVTSDTLGVAAGASPFHPLFLNATAGQAQETSAPAEPGGRGVTEAPQALQAPPTQEPRLPALVSG